MLQNSKNQVLKKAVSAKVENREAKKEQYNQAQINLKKRTVELEKLKVEQEFAIKQLQLKLD